MLLETQLDSRLTSRRSQVPFVREFFQNFPGIELIAKEIHSRADLKKFLDEARRNRAIRAVHIVAHGTRSRKRSSLVLTNQETVDLWRRENYGLFEGLKKDFIFFSCCQLGQDLELMHRLLKISGSEAIFSYTDNVTDYQAFIVESLFYHLAYGKRISNIPLDEAYEKLRFSLHFLAIDRSRNALADPLLAADIRINRHEYWSSSGTSKI